MDRSVRQQTSSLSFVKNIVTIVGGFGSGKSEVSVNLSRYLATTCDQPVSIADLDIVNPYFRSREAAERLQEFGVRCIMPEGANRHSELPIILPEIRGAIEASATGFGKLILDVGGDDLGARVLSSLADAFREGSYDLLLVLNANRPFTADVAGCIRMITEIEGASKLRFTGIVSNTHLMDETTGTIVLGGLELAREVGRSAGLPVVFLSAERSVLDEIEVDALDLPVLPLDRILLKPWERPGS
jgi:hypothetical protein